MNNKADRRVYAVVRRIPPGRVAVYGQIARLAGLGRAARRVGFALGRCEADIPWHRVINAQGRISSRSERRGAEDLQRRLLEAEGVRFGPSGRVDLREYLWEPPIELGRAAAARL